MTQYWSDMKAEKQPEAPKTRYASVDALIPYIRNARTHDDKNVALIAGSISEFGFTNPVLADDKGIVAGHGRVLGAQKLYAAGLPIKLPNGDQIPFGTVPVVDCSGWSDTKRRAYILADNSIALASGWNDELLKVELADLKLEGFDLDLLGFGDLLTDLLDPDLNNPDKDPDAAPDVPDTPHSKLGDIWCCGPHRIMCGSSLLPADWSALMCGELADLCITDPPYNVAFESKLAGSIKNDDMPDKEFRAFLFDAFHCLYSVMKPGASIYVYHADLEGYNFRGAFRDAGFHTSGCLIWKKNALVLGRSPYQWIHESCLFGFKKGAAHRFFGGRKQVTVTDFGEPFTQQDDGTWAIEVNGQTLVIEGNAKVKALESSMIYCNKPKRSKQHPTMKPTELLLKNMRNSGRINDIVVDAFGGSGSTMIAADMIGMVSRSMELDPKFVDVQAQRYFEWTGRVPTHAVTGEQFPVKKSADGEVKQ